MDLLLRDFQQSHTELFNTERVRRALSLEIDAHVVQIEMRFDRLLRLLEAIDGSAPSLVSARARLERARDRLRTAIASTEIVIDVRPIEEPASSAPYAWILNVEVHVAAIDRIMAQLEPDLRELEAINRGVETLEQGVEDALKAQRKLKEIEVHQSRYREQQAELERQMSSDPRAHVASRQLESARKKLDEALLGLLSKQKEIHERVSARRAAVLELLRALDHGEPQDVDTASPLKNALLSILSSHIPVQHRYVDQEARWNAEKGKRRRRIAARAAVASLAVAGLTVAVVALMRWLDRDGPPPLDGELERARAEALSNPFLQKHVRPETRRRLEIAASREELDAAFSALVLDVDRDAEVASEIYQALHGTTVLAFNNETEVVRFKPSPAAADKIQSILGERTVIGLRADYRRVPAEVRAQIEQPSVMSSRALPLDIALDHRLVCDYDVGLELIARAKFGNRRVDISVIRSPIPTDFLRDAGCDMRTLHQRSIP